MLITVDPLKPAGEQKGLMNRWHPAIPPAATVKPDTVFKLGCHEWTGGQIRVRSSTFDPRRSASIERAFLSFPTPEKKALRLILPLVPQNSDDSDDVANVDLTRIRECLPPTLLRGRFLEIDF